MASRVGAQAGAATATTRAAGRRAVWSIVAVVGLVAASQAQLLIWEMSQVTTVSPRALMRTLAVLAVPVMIAGGGWARRFPVPGGRRLDYAPGQRFGVMAWAASARALIVPIVVVVVAALFSVPRRELDKDVVRGVVEWVTDGIVGPALWEEVVWRLVVLGLLLRVVDPRTAVILTAVSFANCAHVAQLGIRAGRSRRARRVPGRPGGGGRTHGSAARVRGVGARRGVASGPRSRRRPSSSPRSVHRCRGCRSHPCCYWLLLV